jgi:hypothetical protein
MPNSPFKFVELGRGKNRLASVFVRQKSEFSGGAVAELDRVPDESTTPKESAEISQRYLGHNIGMSV